jgi:very-short-patch-repair endonuclease
VVLLKRRPRLLESIVLHLARDAGLPAPVFEYRFHPPRRFRFDICWPAARVAIEQEGGVWSAGRHVRPQGYLRDLEKYNLAVVDGWRVLRYTPEQIRAGLWVDAVQRLLDGRTGTV